MRLGAANPRKMHHISMAAASELTNFRTLEVTWREWSDRSMECIGTTQAHQTMYRLTMYHLRLPQKDNHSSGPSHQWVADLMKRLLQELRSFEHGSPHTTSARVFREHIQPRQTRPKHHLAIKAIQVRQLRAPRGHCGVELRPVGSVPRALVAWLGTTSAPRAPLA